MQYYSQVLAQNRFIKSAQFPSFLLAGAAMFLVAYFALLSPSNLEEDFSTVRVVHPKDLLNFLKNDFTLFYTSGIRFNWAFGGLYTQKNEKKLIEINQKTIELQKETFLLNTNGALKQQQSEVDKLKQLIAKDEEIIALREDIKNAANAQLENGVITANDYLREVNAADQSRQSLITHQIQLLQAQINYQTISGKQ